MSLIATRVQDWRIATPQFDKNMTRQSEYGALDFFVSQTESGRSFITPELRDRALNSIGRGLDIPAINYDGDVTVSNARSCTIPDNDNTSALYRVIFQTLSVGFTMVPTLHMNNLISYNHDFARKMEKITRALATALDQGAVATLAANKTQVFRDALEYAVTGNVIKTSWDNRMEIMGDIDPIMRANDYPGQIHIIGNAGIESNMRKMAQLGANNAINKVLEYAGKIFHYTNNVANENGIFGNAFAVEDGHVGYLTRAGRENIRGARSNFHEWDIVNLPILNMPVDTHYYTEVGDQSAVAGESSADMICNVKEFFGFAVDVAYLVSYNSDPDIQANPIINFDIASPTGNRAAIPVTVTNAADFPG